MNKNQVLALLQKARFFVIALDPNSPILTIPYDTSALCSYESCTDDEPFIWFYTLGTSPKGDGDLFNILLGGIYLDAFYDFKRNDNTVYGYIKI